MSFLKIPAVPQFLLTDTSEDSGSDREDEKEFQIDSDITANHTQENVETTKKVATSVYNYCIQLIGCNQETTDFS